MVQSTERKEIRWNPKSFDMQDIIDNFTNVFDDMAANSEEITALAQHQTWTIVKMFDTPGKNTIIKGSKHLRCKVVNAFCTLGDNVDAAVSAKYLEDTCAFTATENSGKTRAIRFPTLNQIHYKDAVEVEQRGDRRLIYTFTFESVEEED